MSLITAIAPTLCTTKVRAMRRGREEGYIITMTTTVERIKNFCASLTPQIVSEEFPDGTYAPCFIIHVKQSVLDRFFVERQWNEYRPLLESALKRIKGVKRVLVSDGDVFIEFEVYAAEVLVRASEDEVIKRIAQELNTYGRRVNIKKVVTRYDDPFIKGSSESKP